MIKINDDAANMDAHDVSIFVVTESNEYVEYKEFDKQNDGSGVFVCVTNDSLDKDYGTNNSICIHGNWRRLLKTAAREHPDIPISKDKAKFICASMQSEFALIPDNGDFEQIFDLDTPDDCKSFLDGNRSCQNIMSNVAPLLNGTPLYQYIPAIMLAHTTHVRFNGIDLHGYLPAIGQLVYMEQNIKQINTALKNAGTTPFAEIDNPDIFLMSPGKMAGSWWSSTFCGMCDTWSLDMGQPSLSDKVNNQDRVMPPLHIIIINKLSKHNDKQTARCEHIHNNQR